MTMPRSLKRRRALALLFPICLTGCWSGPRAYDVNISVEKASWPRGIPTMEVDLVAVTDIELKRDGWTSFEVSKYFERGNPVNQIRQQFFGSGKLFRIVFGEGKPEMQSLKRDDPFWQKRLDAGAKTLVIIADLPGSRWEESPGEDPRRIYFPLDSSRWDTSSIEVQLTKLNVSLITPMVDVD